MNMEAVDLLLLMALFWVTDAAGITSQDNGRDKPKCEPLDLEYCKLQGYNQTQMPNSLGHETQVDAFTKGVSWFLNMLEYF